MKANTSIIGRAVVVAYRMPTTLYGGLLDRLFDAGCWIAENTRFSRLGRELAKWSARMEARRAVR